MLFTKISRSVVFCMMMGLVQLSAYAKYSGGTGASDDPYQIGTAADLVALSQNTGDWNGRYFKMIADIDMTGQTFTPIGSTVDVFSGSFDGQKHEISNLTITPNLVENLAQKGTGLFGAFSGNIANVGIVNVFIDVSMYQNSSRVGALAGELTSGTISQCYSKGGSINSGGGGWTGGLVGCLFSGGDRTIEDCYSSTSVRANWRSAGVVGCTRGAHKLNRLAFYGNITNTAGEAGLAITEVHNDGSDSKAGIPPTSCVFKAENGITDANASGLNETELLQKNNYPTFDFEEVWKMDQSLGYAVLSDTIIVPELSFFEKIQYQRVESDTSVVWKNFGPGMSGYNEEFWCHPTDTNVMFMGPDMHVTYGTWDNGESWQTVKDCDGDGLDLERTNDMAFSLVDPNYGVAVERRGKVFETKDKGRTWKLIYLIPHAAESPWYNAHSKIAIHPTNDSIWYIGSGGFWDVKGNFRSAELPHGTPRPIHAYGYILKTTDRGKTWAKIGTEISNKLDVGRILINPNNPDKILIAAGQGMFVSNDAGATWSPSNSGLPNNLPKDLCAYYNSETKEYILYTVEQSVYTETGNTISTQGGVYKSTDDGVNWTNITGNLGLNFNAITEYGFRDNYAKAVAFWLGKDKSYVSSKAYPNFTLPVFRRLVVNPNNKNELYLVPNQRHDRSFGPGDVWKTEDGGTTWKIVTRHGYYWHEAKDANYWASKGMVTTPNVEFAHLQAALDEQLETSSANRHLAINQNGHVFIGINQQTHRSIDGGESWQQIDDEETAPGSNAWIGRGDSNLPGRFILSETGITGRMLFCSGEHGLWETADLGDYPDKDAMALRQIEGQVHDVGGTHSAHSVSTVAVHPNDPNTIFILAWRQEHRGWLRKTTDGGKTWNNVVQLFDSDNAGHESTASQNSLIIDPVNPNNMYFTATYKPISCGTNGGPGQDLTLGQYGVHRSTNGGNSWSVINNGLPANGSVNRIIFDPKNPETLYAAVNQWTSNDPYGLYKSTNKGDNWTKMSIPSNIRSVNNIFIDKNTHYLYISCGTRTGEYNAGGVYRSKNNGASWDLFFEAPYVWYCETSPVNSNKVLVNAAGQVGGTFKNPGFYLSEDDGETWRKINRGIGQPDKMVDIEWDPYNENIMYSAGWGSGWFKAMLPYDGVKAVCNDTSVVENKELTLLGMGSLGSQLNYKWIAPDGIQLSSVNDKITTFTAPKVTQDSVLVFQLVVSNDEKTDTAFINVTVINTWDVISEIIPENGINIYPNPVQKGLLYIDNADLEDAFSILSVEGKQIAQGEIINGLVDVSDLNTGIYLINIKGKQQNIVKRFIVAK